MKARQIMTQQWVQNAWVCTVQCMAQILVCVAHALCPLSQGGRKDPEIRGARKVTNHLFAWRWTNQWPLHSFVKHTHFFSNFISLKIGGPGIKPPFPIPPALQLSYKWYSGNHNALCHTYITTTSNYCKQLMDGEINTDLFSLVGKRKNVCLSEERTQLWMLPYESLFWHRLSKGLVLLLYL